MVGNIKMKSACAGLPLFIDVCKYFILAYFFFKFFPSDSTMISNFNLVAKIQLHFFQVFNSKLEEHKELTCDSKIPSGS